MRLWCENPRLWSRQTARNNVDKVPTLPPCGQLHATARAPTMTSPTDTAKLAFQNVQWDLVAAVQRCSGASAQGSHFISQIYTPGGIWGGMPGRRILLLLIGRWRHQSHCRRVCSRFIPPSARPLSWFTHVHRLKKESFCGCGRAEPYELHHYILHAIVPLTVSHFMIILHSIKSLCGNVWA